LLLLLWSTGVWLAAGKHRALLEGGTAERIPSAKPSCQDVSLNQGDLKKQNVFFSWY